MLYMVLQLPLGVVYFTVAVVGLSVGAWLIGVPFVQLLTGHSYVNFGSDEFLFQAWVMPFMIVAGALLIVGWLHLVRWTGKAHAAYAKAMLVRVAQ